LGRYLTVTSKGKVMVVSVATLLKP